MEKEQGREGRKRETDKANQEREIKDGVRVRSRTKEK